VRLTRSNDDPQLLDDLERLARVHGDPDREPQPLAAEAPPAGVPEVQAAADAGDPSPLDDPFVRRFVRASVHVKRYLPFYAGAAVWALAMLLIQPLGRGGDRDAANLASATTGAGVARSSTAGNAVAAAAIAPAGDAAVAAPVYDDFGGSSLTSSSSAFDTGSSDFSSSGSFASSASESSTGSDTATFDDSTFSDTTSDFGNEPEPLTITASGYASRIGGTPLEQDPGKGILPVAATGGNDNKRSFIRLRGDDTTLRLQEAASGQVRSDSGAIKACVITADWTPTRAQSLESAPAFDATNCSTGVRDATGLWTFDLSNFAPLADAKGFALTPGAGTALTFEVQFSPTPVAAGT
jgi:hypothetical protein